MNSTYNVINTDWSFNNEKRYKWIYNLLRKDFTDFNYNIEDYLIKIDLNKLIQFIKKLDLSDSSKEALYFTVSKYLQLNDPTNKNIINFQNEGHKLLKKIRDKDGENEIDEDKKEAYQNYNYFLEILKNKDYLKITDIKEHYEYILLSLLILNPPLRPNFYASAFLTKTEQTEDNKNYILLKEIGKKKAAYIIVNNDKVSKTKQYKEDNLKNNIEIENKTLIDLLFYSFEKFPRTYLFEINNKKLTENHMRQYLRNITNINNINFDIIRSIYITHFYKTTAQTVKSRTDLSIKMRHSPAIAARAYFKIKDDETKEENETIKELRSENDKLKTAINLLILENSTLKEKLNKTKPEETDKLFIKRKADILYRLNNKKSTAKPDTLTKYNIIFDDKKKKYI